MVRRELLSGWDWTPTSMSPAEKWFQCTVWISIPSIQSTHNACRCTFMLCIKLIEKGLCYSGFIPLWTMVKNGDQWICTISAEIYKNIFFTVVNWSYHQLQSRPKCNGKWNYILAHADNVHGIQVVNRVELEMCTWIRGHGGGGSAAGNTLSAEAAEEALDVCGEKFPP